MIPILNLYVGFLMDVIMDDSSEEEAENLSDHSDDMLPDDIYDDESDDNSDSQNENPDSPEILENPSGGVQPSHQQPSAQNVNPPATFVENNEQKSVTVVSSSEVKKSFTSSPRENSEDDGQNCTICFEPWTNSSEHRLVSLRCGHLFGRSCISRWLKGQSARCPQCNARARKSEIRNIYAKSVKVIDSSERDKAVQDLLKESELRRKAEISAAQERLKHMMALQECERLKKELMEANKLLSEYRNGAKVNVSSQSSKPACGFTLEKCLDIAKLGGCRIVDTCDLLGMILVSQPSNNDLFNGYGFRKISTIDMKPAEFVLVHQKPIRDMAFHVHDGLVLTASLDKTLRITNVLSNSVVQTYNVESDVWSCAWDADDPVYFYGGLKTGEVYVFDIRVTSRYVYQLPRFGAKTPVVSLQYLRSPVSASPRKCGPIVGKLSDCALQQKTEISGFYTIVPLPSLGPFTSLSTEASGHFLISCRPSPKQPRVNHTLCEFIANPAGDLVWYPVQTFLGGRNQVQLTRSKLLSHPEKASSLLVCAGDEDARGALIWDASSGDCMDNLRSDSPVLDIAGLKINHKSFLTALTDKTLRLYSWNGL